MINNLKMILISYWILKWFLSLGNVFKGLIFEY